MAEFHHFIFLLLFLPNEVGNSREALVEYKSSMEKVRLILGVRFCKGLVRPATNPKAGFLNT